MFVKVSKVPMMISVPVLLLAMGSLFPSEHYNLLYLVVCASAVYLFFKSKALKKKGWMRAMLVIALLFNPLLPIRLGKVDMVLVETVAACIFITSLVKIRDKEEPQKINMSLIKIIIGLLFVLIIAAVAVYCYFLKTGRIPQQ